MATTRAQTSPRPLALIEALLSGNRSMATRLLEGSGAAQLAHSGPAGVTSLHAAVAASRADLIARLVELGATVDAVLECHRWEKPLTRVLQNADAAVRRRFKYDSCQGYTALALAVRCNEQFAVEELLRLGASVNAGSHGQTAMTAAVVQCSSSLIAGPLLLHGGDALSPDGRSWLVRFANSSMPHSIQIADQLLVQLEQQRASGQLPLWSTARALELVKGAAARGHLPLVQHGLASLETAASPPAAAALSSTLLFAVSGGSPDVLQALLGSALPFDVSAWDNSMPLLAEAATGGPAVTAAGMPPASRDAEGAVRALLAAGAGRATESLLTAIDLCSAEGVAAILSCCELAVDTTRPAARASYRTSWSCPIHRALAAFSWPDYLGRIGGDRRGAVIRVLEVLLEAGYRPTTWANTAAPFFAQFSLGQAVLPVLDPFDMFEQEGSVDDSVMFVARGGSFAWTPATHHHWPPRFKAAARAILLAARREGGGGRAAGLGALPLEVVQLVLQKAAAPMGAWL